ncbi:MAG: restriction endonuclease subunit S [Clostridiales bacterium]|nr:restriction endonuclease subunit S [Clostridiales bacterium]
MVPKLRFKEFCGEWAEFILKDVVDLRSEKYNPQKSDKNYKCIELEHLSQETGEIIGSISSLEQKSIKNKFYKDDILYGKLRPYLRKYAYCTFEGVCSSEIWVLNSTTLNNRLLFYYIQTNEFQSVANISSGTKMPRADWNKLKLKKIKVPSLPEQTKIADFLSTVDDKIQNQQDKITHLENIKKGFMQKIFSRKIRFKDDGGEEFSEWEEKRIGEIYIDRNEKPNKKMELLSVTINNGVIKRSDIEGKDNSSEDKSNYKVVYKGDMVYNSMRMWQGASGISSYDGIVSPAYTVMKNKVDINNVFFAYLFKQPELIFKFRRFSQGLTSDTWNLKYPQIKEIKIKIPCLKEQQKIADFLSAFDEKISTEKETLEHLKQLKKGLLQQMFV